MFLFELEGSTCPFTKLFFSLILLSLSINNMTDCLHYNIQLCLLYIGNTTRIETCFPVFVVLMMMRKRVNMKNLFFLGESVIIGYD